MERMPSKSVIDAVIESSSDRIVASDVATRAGVSLSLARKDLTTLASLSRGDISVSTDGELVYEFPPNLRAVLASNSAKYKTLELFEKAWPALFWTIRVSFGVTLVSSVVLVFSTLLALQSSTNTDGGSDDDSSSFVARSFLMRDFAYVFDILYYRPHYGYYGRREARQLDSGEMGFLESVYSYVFGDGNPNLGLEEMRLRMAAQMIRANNGAVTAEQLAVYCDAPDPDGLLDATAYVDESFVLPIVSQLDGEPRVTEDGDIIYVFPDLQTSTVTSSATTNSTWASESITSGLLLSKSDVDTQLFELVANISTTELRELFRLSGIETPATFERKDFIDLLELTRSPPILSEIEQLGILGNSVISMSYPSLLEEAEHVFSLAPVKRKVTAGTVGLLNLFGVLLLRSRFSELGVLNASARLPSYLGVAQSLSPFLLCYAILFNAVPLGRTVWISVKNRKIQKRNKARRKWRDRLTSGAGSVGRKLKAAAKFGTGQKVVVDDEVIFSTKQSASALECDRNKNDLDDFDWLLLDREQEANTVDELI